MGEFGKGSAAVAGAIGLAAAVCAAPSATAQSVGPVGDAPPSVARTWTDAALYGIRRDFARPPVHARNLYHLSAAMYDAWAVLDGRAAPVFLGRADAPAACALAPADGEAFRAAAAADASAARDLAVGQAAVRVLRRRFANAASTAETFARLDALAAGQGLATTIGDPASADALGARAADCALAVGLADGANEAANYANAGYAPVNPPLNPTAPGNPGLQDPDRWQPLAFDTFVDQSGNVASATEFLAAEWGEVTPFALAPADRTTVPRDGVPQLVWLDPGPPPFFGDGPGGVRGLRQFALADLAVVLAPRPRRRRDRRRSIPRRAGAPARSIPDADLETDPLRPARASTTRRKGGQRTAIDSVLAPWTPPSGARATAPNVVPLGDYARGWSPSIWADGHRQRDAARSLAPIIYNRERGSAHPALERRRRRRGRAARPARLRRDRLPRARRRAARRRRSLPGRVKGAYDYDAPDLGGPLHGRPRSAHRLASIVNRNAQWLPVVPWAHRIAGARRPASRHVPGARRRGPGCSPGAAPRRSDDPEDRRRGRRLDTRPEAWWPYQRPSFVTPPFAGYVSGHSTFSRAAAVVLEAPDRSSPRSGRAALAGFVAHRRTTFLVFERGPSVDVTLQWATYRDAADQTSLSRIWGGIHPAPRTTCRDGAWGHGWAGSRGRGRARCSRATAAGAPRARREARVAKAPRAATHRARTRCRAGAASRRAGART